MIADMVWLIAFLALSAAPLVLSGPLLAAKYPRFGLRRFLAATAAGLAAVVPAAVVQALLPHPGRSVLGLFATAFLLIALTEEGSKYGLLRVFRGRWGEGDHAVPAGVAASLGFAFFETAAYAAENPAALLVRAVTAAPLHAACGIWVGKAVFSFPGKRLVPALYLGFAAVVHGAYDLSLLVPGFPSIVPILIAGLGLLSALRSRAALSPGDD